MNKTTDFGKAVKIRLIEMEQTQEWLVEQVRDRTGDFFDGSYLHKILTGKIAAESGRNSGPGKAQIIREILGMNQDTE